MIDKITPKFLATSRDERLAQPGAMIDAQNVTISQEGDGTSMVLKNAKGTIAASHPLTEAIAANREVRVVGSVEDDQRGFIYFFVCGVSSADDHAIYAYRTATNAYTTILKTSWLNFSKESFVKGSVVNRNFQQDDNLQTVLYFTDNVNPPRKINVDRPDDYDFVFDNSRDHALGVIKAPLIEPVSFTFGSDPNLKVNNFLNHMFQFATQLIYKDGEESVLSPYSEIAVSSVTGLQGLDDDTDLSGKDYLTDNFLNITIPYTNSESVDQSYRPEVISMRILGRDQNASAWLILDEFDPNKDLSRKVYGNTVKVFDSDTKTYKFYNEGIYSAAPTADVSKTYDNVPLVAEGQAFVGNRLMYSNYKEGRANHPKPDASNPHGITVKYKNVNTGTVSIPQSTATNVIVRAADNTGNIDIKPLDADGTDAFSLTSSAIPDGSLVEYGFTIVPQNFSIGGNSGGNSDQRFWGSISSSVSGQNVMGINLMLDSEQITFVPDDTDDGYNINGNIVMPANSTIDDLLDSIVDRINVNGGSFTQTYQGKNDGHSDGICRAKLVTLNGNNAGTVGFNAGDTFDLAANKFEVIWKWTASKSSNKVIVKPYPSQIKWTSTGGVVGGGTLIGATTFDTDFELDTNSALISVMDTALGFSGGATISNNVPYVGTAQTSWPAFDAADANTAYLEDEEFQMQSKGVVSTFKSGASHKLGVVYYDKYGRHGFVNDIGQFYVKTFQERVSGADVRFGAAEVLVSWAYDMPAYADRWSLVYGGNTSFDNAIQYTVGSAFTAVKDDNNTADESNKRVYVSLATLEKFEENKSPTFEYSFTKGDRLRIVSHQNDTNNAVVHPHPNGSSTRFIEFNVVDVVTLGATNNPLTTTLTAEDQFQGRFLVLDAPDVNGGAVDSDGNVVKFPGFDWFTVTKLRHGGNYTGTYPNGDSITGDNKWHQKCLVEIVSPKTTDTGVYYEIGVTGKKQPSKAGFSTDHGPNVTINGAEYFMRTRSCATKDYAANNAWQTPQANVKKDMVFLNTLVETKSASDFFKSDSWSQGKPHVKFERAAEVRRYNGITYSDAYEEDVAKLSLSSFNASLANFVSVDSKFGAARYIENYNDDLICLQENKVSKAPVSKDILRTASDQGLVSLSTNVLGSFIYYAGDYGVESHPESVLVNDGDVYFADFSRRKVLKYNASQGVVPISDTDVSSLFEDEFASLFSATGVKKIVSGFDPKTDMYYITLHAKDDSGGYAGKTIGYDTSVRKWISTYTFVPDFYAHQNRLMYSASYVSSNGNLFFRHEDNSTSSPTNRNTFYGASVAASVVEVVSKEDPSNVKQFNSISIEGDKAWRITGDSSLGQTTGGITASSKREGGFYIPLSRDTSSNSTSQKIGLGKVTAVNGETFTFENSFRGTVIPVGANITRIANGSTTHVDLSQTISAVDRGAKTITASASGHGVTVNDNILIRTASQVNGDAIRGSFLKVKAELLTENTPVELYAINTNYTASRHNHALGQ